MQLKNSLKLLLSLSICLGQVGVVSAESVAESTGTALSKAMDISVDRTPSAGEAIVSGDMPSAGLAVLFDLRDKFAVFVDRKYHLDAGIYEIVSDTEGCLDVAGASMDRGAGIIEWTCHGRSNQLWKITQQSDYFYEVRALHSNMCLDVYGNSQQDGARVIQWRCHGGDNQRWLFVPQNDGSVALIAKHSMKAIQPSVNAYGAEMQQTNAGEHHTFRLKPSLLSAKISIDPRIPLELPSESTSTEPVEQLPSRATH